jgi:very-short-patch-repair endonuclease
MGHLKGMGCRECGINKRADGAKYTTEEWVEKCKKKFGDKYDYSLVDYVNSDTKVKIICNKCGRIFEKIPGAHLNQEQGCPDCFFGWLGELKIRDWLEANRINYFPQKKFDDLFDKNKLRYDFYLPDFNLIIEHHGKQHYEPVEYFGGVEKFYERVRHDKMKEEYAKKNGIEMLIISYKENILNKLEEKLHEIIVRR